jgi:hypothetical protein
MRKDIDAGNLSNPGPIRHLQGNRLVVVQNGNFHRAPGSLLQFLCKGNIVKATTAQQMPQRSSVRNDKARQASLAA